VEGLKVRVQALIKGNDFEGLQACIEEARSMPSLQFRRSSGRGREGGREGGKEGGREGGVEVSMVQVVLDGPFTEHQVTALMLATYLGQEEMVSLLLKEGAEVHARALGGGTFPPLPSCLPPSLPPSLGTCFLTYPPSLPPSLPP